MVMDTCQKFDVFAPVAVVERVINNEHLGRIYRRQRQNRFVEDAGTEQMQELSPVDMDRIEKAVNGIFADLAAGSISLKITEEILAGENQAEDHPHDHHRSDAALFEHVALLE